MPRWRRRSGSNAFKSKIGRKGRPQALEHGVSRFADRHHADFRESTQLDRDVAAMKQRSFHAHLALHHRGNINGRQGFVENQTGEMFKIRHGRITGMRSAYFQDFGVQNIRRPPPLEQRHNILCGHARHLCARLQ